MLSTTGNSVVIKNSNFNWQSSYDGKWIEPNEKIVTIFNWNNNINYFELTNSWRRYLFTMNNKGTYYNLRSLCSKDGICVGHSNRGDKRVTLHKFTIQDMPSRTIQI